MNSNEMSVFCISGIKILYEKINADSKITFKKKKR